MRHDIEYHISNQIEEQRPSRRSRSSNIGSRSIGTPGHALGVLIVWALLALIYLLTICISFCEFAARRLRGEDRDFDRHQILVFLAPVIFIFFIFVLSTTSSPPSPADATRLTEPHASQQWHDLNQRKSLTPEEAKELTKHPGDLTLDGLETLWPSTAEVLANQEGSLSLDGLAVLELPVAMSLAKHKGTLSLRGLRFLAVKPAQVASALSNHEGVLILDGLKTISAQAAEEIVATKGKVTLMGLESLSAEAAATLRRNSQIQIPERFH